ncbi:MAG: hypothetical protein K9L70_05340 [Thiohalocapsa sp.]|jgi:hypothetical protein|nr:hypothetical protein [Thiohalocapsa sp.]MCF7991847.1 hypothetical protein [Thiohalocapsa sp.]
MIIIPRITVIAAAVFIASGCESDGGTRSEPVVRDAPSIAETACMERVNANYAGKVRNLTVTSSEFSEANSVVMMNADGETWRCLVSNDGAIQELRVVE